MNPNCTPITGYYHPGRSRFEFDLLAGYFPSACTLLEVFPSLPLILIVDSRDLTHPHSDFDSDLSSSGDGDDGDDGDVCGVFCARSHPFLGL